MYIKNQVFKDEDTLLEMLFDFALGEPGQIISDLLQQIEAAMKGDAALQEHLKSLEEEYMLELEDDIRQENLSRGLMQLFTSFKVQSAHLYGINEESETLLYSVDLH
ncbi:MAG: hypothetical protein EOP51_01930 [Sphingobacteriales bacterium]|nr:MAG: hypothetical protein EOP51_01930 [Sphingobacteriales bacterium]